MSNFWQNYFSVFFNKAKVTISTVSATTQTISSSVVKTEVLTNTRDWNESICISFRVYYDIFIKGGQAVIATEVQVTSFYVKPNPKTCLCCVWHFFYFVYGNFSMLFMEYFDYSFLSILCMTFSLISTFLYYIIHFIFFSRKKMSILTWVCGHVGHHILHEEELNRRRYTALAYDPKEYKFLLYCPFYGKHLEEYTKNVVARTQHLSFHRR